MVRWVISRLRDDTRVTPVVLRTFLLLQHATDRGPKALHNDLGRAHNFTVSGTRMIFFDSIQVIGIRRLRGFAFYSSICNF